MSAVPRFAIASSVDTHAHVFERGLPMPDVRRYAPDADASLATYLQHLDTHGLAYGVLVQPSFLGTDNSHLLQALRAAPARLRGVAVVDPAIDAPGLQALAAADALRSLAGHRRQQVWDAAAQLRAPPLLRDAPVEEESLALPEAPEGEEILFDYAATGLTLRRHPLALLRPRLARWRLQTALQLVATPHGRQVRACGIVTVRQRPGTAKGTMFVTLAFPGFVFRYLMHRKH